MKELRPVVCRPEPDPATLAALDGVSELHARLYAMRGVTSVRQIDYGLRALAPVGLLENLDGAVDLLLQHRHGRIVVVGDYDVDGATSTALLLRALDAFGFESVDYLVPNRFDYGYGLSPEIVQRAAESEPTLLITVDNGISSIAGVRAANDLGIPVLVTDHHLPGNELPDAAVIVNPNLPGSRFPSRHLAGVGVAFYLMAALGRALGTERGTGAARVPSGMLDLVALGTVADVVPLDHNNRVLVEQGLRRIRAGHTVPGIAALLDIAGRRTERVTSSDLGFAVGPRINAAGRLEDIGVGIECLLTDDASEAARLAGLLDSINRERRHIEAEMRDQAFAYVAATEKSRWPACVSVFDAGWHQGIVGLIAARLRERCHRPVIAFAPDSDPLLKGSARSVPGVHVRDLLEAVASSRPGLIVKFGGHAMAAGLTIAKDDLAEFSELAAAATTRLYPDADFSGGIVTDGRLPIATMNLDAARALRNAGPWGAGFPEPLWLGNFTVDAVRTVGDGHLKMRVRPVDGDLSLDAIAFNQSATRVRGVVQLVYRLDVNEYRGAENVQLVVEQIAPVKS